MKGRHITGSDEWDDDGDELVMKNGWKEPAGGQMRANLKILFDIASAARAPGQAEDITLLEGRRLARWMGTGPINAVTTQRWCRPTLVSGRV